MQHDIVFGDNKIIPMQNHLAENFRLRRRKIVCFCRVCLQIVQLPFAAAKRLAHPQQLPVTLPDGAVAEQLPADPVCRATHGIA